MLEPYEIYQEKSYAVKDLSEAKTVEEAEEILLRFIANIGFPELTLAYRETLLNLSEQ